MFGAVPSSSEYEPVAMVEGGVHLKVIGAVGTLEAMSTIFES